MPLRYAITYEIVTPESAEDGDAAERGFVIDGFDCPIDEVMADREGHATEMELDPVDLDCVPVWALVALDDLSDDDVIAAYSFYAAIVEHGWTEPSCSGETNARTWYTQPDDDENIRTGERRREAFHPHGISETVGRAIGVLFGADQDVACPVEISFSDGIERCSDGIGWFRTATAWARSRIAAADQTILGTHWYSSESQGYACLVWFGTGGSEFGPPDAWGSSFPRAIAVTDEEIDACDNALIAALEFNGYNVTVLP